MYAVLTQKTIFMSRVLSRPNLDLVWNVYLKRRRWGVYTP